MKKYILLCILILTTGVIFSQSYKINDIYIKGLKRTRYKTVLDIIEVKKGDTVKVSNIESLKQKLLKAGIFTNNVDVQLNPIGGEFADLNILAEDKWTLIPLPFFSYSQDSVVYGGFFIESNLFGMKHSLISGAIYNSGDFTSFLVWALPKKNKNTISFTLSLNFGDKVNTDFYNNTLEEVDNNVYGGGINYTRDFTNELSGRVSLKSLSKNGDLVFNNNYQLTYDNTKIGDFFTTGIKTTFGFDSEFILDKQQYNKVLKYELELDTLVFNNLLTIIAKSNYSLDKDSYYSLFGASKGALIIPKKNVHINNAICGHIAYEIKLLDFNWGFISIPLFYESGVIELHSDKKQYYYHGPGGGINLYMKKVAIPAMGLFYTYDILNSRYNFNFSIGSSF